MPYYLINVKLITDKYLTEAEVAELTGRAIGSLRNDRHHRLGLPFCKVGRSVRYDADDVLAFMESRKIKTNENL
jgi:hypothetical protein